MKLYDYYKEKFIFILVSFFVFITMLLFLYVTKTQLEIIITIAFLFWGLLIFMFIIDYTKRKKTYDEIAYLLENLDQKYLLCECFKEPDFVDGKLLYKMTQQINKSMIDHVNSYKFAQLEYKEYIEMWVHEVKTPLAAMQLILENHPSPQNESVIEEINKVEAYVEQALFYARGATLEKDYLVKETQLDEIVNKVIRKHSKDFIYRKIKLNLESLDFTVYTDSKWVEFIIDQILNNALKYCDPDNPEITFIAKQHPNAILLEIKDNGCGVSSSELSRVFDKGFTGTNGRNTTASTGIGLYLCKQLCNKLNLDLQMRMSEQTCVSISFPIDSYMMK